jgi:hypothetical protein
VSGLNSKKNSGDSLYVDTLPHEVDIKQAILTLREGDAWYRIFQGRWRKAVGTAQGTATHQAKMPGQKRLEQLEQIVKLLGLKEQWKSSPTWTQFLGFPAPATPPHWRDTLRWQSGIEASKSPQKISKPS